MQGAVCSGAGKGELRGLDGMLLPGQKILILGTAPFLGVPVIPQQAVITNCTCGWVMRGSSSQGGQIRQLNPAAVGKMDQEGLCLAPGQVCLWNSKDGFGNCCQFSLSWKNQFVCSASC